MLECPSREHPAAISSVARVSRRSWNLSPASQPAAPPRPERTAPREHRVVDRLAAGRVEHRVLQAAPGAGRFRCSAKMSRSQRGRPIVLALPFGRADRAHRGAAGVAAGHVPLDRLAHMQHAAQRVCFPAPQRPQLAVRNAVEREFRPTQGRVGAVSAARHGTGSRLAARRTDDPRHARPREREPPRSPLSAVCRTTPGFPSFNRRLRGVGRAG
jgi:hypothetical protein